MPRNVQETAIADTIDVDWMQGSPDRVVIDLGQELFAGMPVHESHPPYIYSPYLRHGDFELPGQYWGTNELLIMSGHTGTHIDALSHIAFDGKFFDGSSALDAQRGGRGLRHLAAETIAPIVGRGVYLDLATAHGVDVLPRAYAIGADEVHAMLQGASITLRERDTILVRTGFGSLWESGDAYLAGTLGNPGIDPSAAEYLSSFHPTAVGSDTSVVEHQPVGAETLPVHRRLIAELGIHLIENMNFEDMPRTRVLEFLFVCAPLKVRGSSGGPVRPIAILTTPSS